MCLPLARAVGQRIREHWVVFDKASALGVAVPKLTFLALLLHFGITCGTLVVDSER